MKFSWNFINSTWNSIFNSGRGDSGIRDCLDLDTGISRAPSQSSRAILVWSGTSDKIHVQKGSLDGLANEGGYISRLSSRRGGHACFGAI